MKYQEIIRSINKKEIANTYLFTGEENYLKEDIIQAIKGILLNEASSDFNFNVFDAAESDEGREAVEVSNTLPLLFGGTTGGIGRLIVLKNIDKLPEMDRKLLSAYLSEPLESTCLILITDKKKIDGRKKYNKEIESNSVQVIFYRLFDNQIPGWLAGEVKKHKKSISPEAAQCLISGVGSDLFALKSEVEKLVNFVGDRETIEAGDIERVLGYVKGITVSDLQKAITYKDVKGSLRIMNALLDENSRSQVMILAVISTRLRQLALAKAMLKQGRSEEAIIKNFGINLFYNRYLVKASCNFTDNELEKGFSCVLNADVEIKTGKKPPRLSLELLVMKICMSHGIQ